jgi:hypothetical protein
LNLPSDDLLNEINRKMIFLKAHQIALTEGRITVSIANSLIEEGTAALTDIDTTTASSTSNKPTLLANLDKEITNCVGNLQNLIQITNEKFAPMEILSNPPTR